MPDIYTVIVVLLFILAISDLIVGVSNDAVNFLNSSIGSKVASRRVIMIVASLGIFVGATFSSGMMEVARKGVFNPEFFHFSDVMVLFLAVMLTDIILLDLFNTFGMPTSTTVSIVFELLGAAVMVAGIKLVTGGRSLTELGSFINSAKAATIVSGIFLSILFAFTAGMLVQYFSRLLFTFNYKKRMKTIGVLWSGMALAALTYFLLLKGVKGASFVTDGFVNWVQRNTLLLFAISFGVWSGVMFLLTRFKVNIFRIVVLFGTFSLAMAFAGNDLVNFIGVPIAGLESFTAWDNSGVIADEFGMGLLQKPVRTNSLLLIMAGGVMILTLWFSKKARSVTDTEVNLGRQSDGHERFSPNMLSRWIVRQSNRLGRVATNLMPASWIERSKMSFESEEDGNENKASFDLIRASVNLTVASILVAFATSLKLPLSTTYVSFMVAMGTSLADKAWGRDSAVYRVAGVINVIGGWFATAIIAFTASAIFALIISLFKLPAIAILVALAFTLIYRTFRYHKKKEKQKNERETFENQEEPILLEEVNLSTASRISMLLKTVENSCSDAFVGLIKEDRDFAYKAYADVKRLVEENESLKYSLFKSIERIEEVRAEGSKKYLLVYDLEQDIVQSTRFVVKACKEHIENGHNPLLKRQAMDLDVLMSQMRPYLSLIREHLETSSVNNTELIMQKKTELLRFVQETLAKQVVGIKQGEYGARNSMLVFSILLEIKDVIAVAARFVKITNRFDITRPGLQRNKLGQVIGVA